MIQFISAMIMGIFLSTGIANSSLIVLHNGTEFILDTGEVAPPRLNNYDEVVWSKRLDKSTATYGIFSSIDGLISSGYVLKAPDINDAGEIIWRFGDGGRGANGIESSIQGIIYSSSGQDPYYGTQRINNNGEIIASNGQGGRYIWSNTRGGLSTSGWFARETEVNDLGEVVYQGYHGNTGNIFDIYSTDRGAITNDENYQHYPDINNFGEVVWQQNNEIWSNLRGKIGNGNNPSINDFGEIVWEFGRNIYSSLRGKITSGKDYDSKPQINNSGSIAFLRDKVTPVPEPTVIHLLCTGLIGIAGFIRKFTLKNNNV